MKIEEIGQIIFIFRPKKIDHQVVSKAEQIELSYLNLTVFDIHARIRLSNSSLTHYLIMNLMIDIMKPVF